MNRLTGEKLSHWMNIMKGIPNWSGQGLPKFFALDGLVALWAGGLFFIAAIITAMSVALVLGRLTGSFQGNPDFTDVHLFKLCVSLWALAALAIQSAHLMGALKISNEQYRWALAVHEAVGLPAPRRDMRKRDLAAYVERAYEVEAERASERTSLLDL